MQPDDYFAAPVRTAKETFAVLGISESLGWRALKTGEIPGRIKLGRRVLVSTAAIRALVEAGPPKADAPAGTEASR